MTFASQLSTFAVRADIGIDLAFKKVAFDLFGAVQRRSPVDTGRFRGSWRLSGSSVADLTVAPKQDGTGNSAALATEAIGKATAEIPFVGAINGFVISNNLIYALPLEEGHSKDQAPQGVARLAALEIEGSLLAGGFLV